VVEFTADAERLHREHHLAAEVCQRVGRWDREVALLLTELVRQVGRRARQLAGIPEPLGGVDLVEGSMLHLLVGDVVEDEELGRGRRRRQLRRGGPVLWYCSTRSTSCCVSGRLGSLSRFGKSFIGGEYAPGLQSEAKSLTALGFVWREPVYLVHLA